MANYNLICGNSLEELKKFDDNTFDSIVTDPPYEIGLNNHKWDNTGIAYNVELWKECLRVLKPGGHLISFSATRTYHRMTVAVEDAGFEIRDQLLWIYGNGMPKSNNLSIELDKLDGTFETIKKVREFTSWLKSTGIKASKIKELTNTNMAAHYLTQGEQPAIPTSKHWDLIKDELLKMGVNIPDWINDFINIRSIQSENIKKREIIGESEGRISSFSKIGEGERETKTFNITKAHSDIAKKYEGWGTSLKPAHEPICLARKPLKKNCSTALNTIEYGVGGLNIDATRVIREGEDSRFTSNLITDESDDIKDIFKGKYKDCWRYFYGIKTSTKERNEGLNAYENKHPTVKPTDLMEYLIKLVTPENGHVLDPFNGSGSTGRGAIKNGFNYTGIDLSSEYIEISKKRIEAVKNSNNEII